MRSRLHHLRCKDTCGTVQSRESLVKLGHSSADTRCFLHDIYFIACVCNIKSSLDTGDTASDHQRAFCNTALAWFQRGIQVYFGNSSPHQDHCLFRCLFDILMNPGTMLADICDLHHIRIQSGSLRCLSEGGLMHTRGTGTDYHSCQILFFDGFCDQRLSCFRTHILIIFCMDNTRLHHSHLCYFFNVYCCCDIASAVTDKYSYSLHANYLLYLLNALTKSCCGRSGSRSSGISSGERYV